MAKIYELDRYRRNREGDVSSSLTSTIYYDVTNVGGAVVGRPVNLQYRESREERTKYMSEMEDFEWNPDLSVDHSWREKPRTTYDAIAEFDFPENDKRYLMIGMFRTEAHPHADVVADRLDGLEDTELDTDEEAISVESLATFLSFLASFVSGSPPAITVTPDGNIYATWKVERGGHCGVEFLPAKNAKLVVMVPGHEAAGTGAHMVGILGITELERTLRLHGIHAW